MPSCSSTATRRSMIRFSSLASGTPKRSSPPGPSSRSNTVTVCPHLLRSSATARAAGPGRAGGPGADDGGRAAGPAGWGRRRDPALGPRPLGDRQLDLLNGDRFVVDRQHACRLARRRADEPGELREVVGGVQLLDRVAPLVAVDEGVPVRDEVAQRAALMAERDAAVHAAGALAAQLLGRLEAEVLLVVVDAGVRVALVEADPVDLEERSQLSHVIS